MPTDRHPLTRVARLLAVAGALLGCQGELRSGAGPAADAARGADTGRPDLSPDATADLGADAGPDGGPDGGAGVDATADAGPGADGGRPGVDAARPPPDPPGCDPTEALAACVGCHGPQRAEAGLDLAAPDLAARLVGVRARTCPSEQLIDPAEPARSLLLRAVDEGAHTAAGFGGPGATCNLALMPPGTGGLPADQVACLTRFVAEAARDLAPDPADVSEPVAPASALRKVKTLLVGDAPTDAELRAVEADPAAFAPLVRTWTATPAFEARLQSFLGTALHQDFVGDLEDQLDSPRGFNPRLRQLQANLAESFARTALWLVREGRPFTEILTTRRWDLTTAAALVLSYADQNSAQRAGTYTIVRTRPAGAPNPVTLEWMVAERTFVAPEIPADCQPPAGEAGPGGGRVVAADSLLDFFLGLVRCAGNTPNFRFANPLLRDEDFTDWRPVDLVNAGEANPYRGFHDLPSLRAADRLALRVRRVGFFTTPAFLANYPTNEDNQQRVIANQALIVALGATFSAADATAAVPSDALNAEHAPPGTECHGCHRLLDPMRVGLQNGLSPRHQRADAPTGLSSGFAFAGYVHPDPVDNPIQLARALAAHPRFAAAWVQRLCYWANSAPCDEADPHFQALAAGFAAGHDLRALVADLFASPLVTGIEPVPLAAGAVNPVPAAAALSITRANHLCPVLAARLDDPAICTNLGAALGLVPRDEFSRGAPAPTLTAAPSTFHFAAAESLCERIAERIVGGAGAGRLLRSDDVAGGLDLLVTRLMALPPAHPRHAGARAALGAHVDAALAQGATPLVALRSATALACLTPDVQGIGL